MDDKNKIDYNLCFAQRVRRKKGDLLLYGPRWNVSRSKEAQCSWKGRTAKGTKAKRDEPMSF